VDGAHAGDDDGDVFSFGLELGLRLAEAQSMGVGFTIPIASLLQVAPRFLKTRRSNGFAILVESMSSKRSDRSLVALSVGPFGRGYASQNHTLLRNK
jgi:hypothetical protein